ncbi:AAA family ATPase [Fontimonas sp. SYSU GA230001]|uniref:ATP-binding protein n=1 Tax=Fontimonas sp. SYSU GA230001 TaxID=3142450 RepID=UPI0032B4376C
MGTVDLRHPMMPDTNGIPLCAAPVQPFAAPRTLAETGLPTTLLGALLAKHLLLGGEQTQGALAARLALAEPIIAELVAVLLAADQLYVLTGADGDLKVGLQASGRGYAAAALAQDGYVGPAPLALPHYQQLVAANSGSDRVVTRADMHAAFADVVVPDDLLDALGHALNSPRPVLVHGPSGAGKTYLCERIAKLLPGSTLVPFAIAVGERCVALFDPAFHDVLDSRGNQDPRLVVCRRPALTTGAELSRDMLDISIDALHGIAQAPLWLRANNGLLIVDDFGRQAVPPDELLRRWALPIEARQDWVRLDGRLAAPVPFDVRLVLVTNLAVEGIDGDALRRTVGPRVAVGGLADADFVTLWHRTCNRLGVRFDAELPRYALEHLYAPRGLSPLPAHPGALLEHMRGLARYEGAGTPAPLDLLHLAWTACFPDTGEQARHPAPVSHRTH